MTNEIIIPEQIPINVLFELLGISSMQQRAKLDILKRYSLESDLLLSTHKEVKGLPINIPLGDIYDGNEFIDHYDAEEQNVEEFYLIKFKLNHYYLTAEKATTCINWFKVNGESFQVVNDNNNDVGELFIDLSKVFVKRSDFINFKKEVSDCVSASRQEVLKHSPLDQRYKFLNEWTQRTLPDVPLDQFIAEYDNELTKETFYNLLSHEYKKNYPNDSNIFTSGLDAFYKDKRVEVKFKVGKRKNC
ncbi:hypothetical protein [Colwellia sp. E150_009]